MMEEGVIRFTAEHVKGALSASTSGRLEHLLGWRSILFDTGLLGQEPGRYGGLGFGNVSHRLGARSAPRGRRPFVVSGTQTSGLAQVDGRHFAEALSWDRREFRLQSRGPVLPSSESMTHAAVYDQAPHIQAVLHVHAPKIWRHHRALGLPATDESVGYGTPEMVSATDRLFAESTVWETGVWVMLGHPDGVVAFGRDVDEAGTRLMKALARARSQAP